MHRKHVKTTCSALLFVHVKVFYFFICQVFLGFGLNIFPLKWLPTTVGHTHMFQSTVWTWTWKISNEVIMRWVWKRMWYEKMSAAIKCKEATKIHFIFFKASYGTNKTASVLHIIEETASLSLRVILCLLAPAVPSPRHSLWFFASQALQSSEGQLPSPRVDDSLNE